VIDRSGRALPLPPGLAQFDRCFDTPKVQDHPLVLARAQRTILDPNVNEGMDVRQTSDLPVDEVFAALHNE
jgi:hypothetical protein